MKYEIWSNVDSRQGKFFDGYQAGDKMKKSYEDVLIPTLKAALLTTRGSNEVLEFLFAKFNHDDRPNGQIAHSLSVGDVVKVGNKAYAVASTGFAPLAEFSPVIGDYER